MVNFGDERLPERFWDKVSPCPMSGCWLWTAYCDATGYGKITYGRPMLAHRLAYLTLVGPIPDETPFLDHRCRLRCCVNPAHLEPVTNAENVRRGIAGQRSSSRTHCPQGHAYEGENLFFIPNKTRSGKSRCCRICKNDRNADYRHRQTLTPLREPSPEVLAAADALLREAMAAERDLLKAIRDAGGATRRPTLSIEAVEPARLLKVLNDE